MRSFYKVERLLMVEEEKKKESWLRQLCGNDAKLYDVLSSTLYLDPIAAIPQEDLDVLIEEAEKSVKDENYEVAMRGYKKAVDKAVLEATQHQEERGRYIKVIKELSSKAAQVTEKVKEKVEKKELTSYAAALERRIGEYKFMRERIEDVIEAASHLYKDILVIQGEKERRRDRIEERRESRREEDSEEKIDKKREKGRKKNRLEEDREEAREEKREKKRRGERREKILEERRRS